MSRHLAACAKRREAAAATDAATDAGRGEPRELVLLQVRDAGEGDFWLYLEVDGDATLKQVDSYLRAIWLECCGHLSEFSTGGWDGRTVGKAQKVGRAFRSGAELTHIYDFGTESVTLLKAIAVREGKRATRHPIALLARNAPPALECQECGEPATHFCAECVYEDEASGTLCARHASSHPHEDYGGTVLLVNSPRMGLCGYEGPAEPPY